MTKGIAVMKATLALARLNSIQLKKLNNLQGLAGGVHVDGGEVLGEREVAELALHVVVCLVRG